MSEVKKQQEIKIMNVADLENLSLSLSLAFCLNSLRSEERPGLCAPFNENIYTCLLELALQ